MEKEEAEKRKAILKYEMTPPRPEGIYQLGTDRVSLFPDRLESPE